MRVREYYGYSLEGWLKLPFINRIHMRENYRAMEDKMNTAVHDTGRNEMWSKLLGPDYRYADKNQKKRMKRMYAHENCVMPYQVPINTGHIVGNYEVSASTVDIPQTCTAVQKEKKMELEIINTTNADSVEAQKARYLKSRAYDVYYTKQAALRREFGLDDDLRPSNVEELVERIKAGTFTIKDNAGDYYGVLDMIKWRDPSKKTDLKGFKTAHNQLDKELKAVLDVAAIGNPADGLAAIQKWEG